MPPACTVTIDQWIQIANAAGAWVAGIGTLAAVIVSLRLARRASNVRIEAKAHLIFIMNPGSSGQDDECIGFEVVNLGDRAVIIESVGWTIGKRSWPFGKRKTTTTVMQRVDPKLGAELPKRLEHGERAEFTYSLREDWAASFVRTMLPASASSLHHLRGQVTTAAGDVIEIKPGHDIGKRLQEALDNRARLER